MRNGRATATPGHSEPQWADTAISALLRGGVLLSVSIIVIGLVLTFLSNPAYVSSPEALGTLTDANHTYPHTVREVLTGARAREGEAVVMIGLLLLVATPVMRVALSIFVFLMTRDHVFVAITSTVLLLLLVSFALGVAP